MPSNYFEEQFWLALESLCCSPDLSTGLWNAWNHTHLLLVLPVPKNIREEFNELKKVFFQRIDREVAEKQGALRAKGIPQEKLSDIVNAQTIIKEWRSSKSKAAKIFFDIGYILACSKNLD